MNLIPLLILSLLLFGRSMGLRLHGEVGITPFQLRLKLGALSPERGAVHFMYMLDKSKSFDALKHLISIPSMTLFQRAFFKSCEMLNRKDFDELVANGNPKEMMARLQVIGIDCLSRISLFKVDIESWDLPIRRILSQDHPFDKKQLYDIFLYASANRGLLSSSFLCGAVKLEQLGFLAPFLIDGPCVVSNPALVKMLVASLEIEQTWLMDHQAPPYFPKLISELIHIGAIMAFASGRMTQQRHTGQFRFIRKQLKDTLNNMKRYETMLSEEERPLFNLAFKMMHTVTANKQVYHFVQLEHSLRAAGMTSFIQLYPRLCQMVDDLNMTKPPIWASQLEIETLIVISRIHPKAPDFPLSVLSLLKRAQEARIMLPVRHLLVLLWSIRMENCQAFTLCHEILINYILTHMMPNSDTDIFRKMDLAKMLPFSWKQTINRNLDSWWDSTGDLPLNEMTKVFVDLHGLPVQLPNLPPIQRCSVEQLDQLRWVVKCLIDIVLDNYMVPTGRKVLANHDWPVYIPVVRSPSFIIGWLWVLLYMARVLRIRLPFHLHPLCLQMLQGACTDLAARFFVSLSLNTEYIGCPPEKQSNLLRQTTQFHKHIRAATKHPSLMVMSTAESFLKFRGFLERWDEGEPIPSFGRLELLVHQDAGMILEFMSPGVDMNDVFEDFLEPAEILAILLSHPSA